MKIFNNEMIDKFLQSIVVVNVNLEIIFFNRAFAQLTGYSANRIKIGELLSKFLDIKDLKALLEGIEKDNIVPKNKELVGTGKNQKLITMIVKPIPIKVESKITSFVLNIIDTTLESKLHKDYKTLDLEKRVRHEAEQRFKISNSLFPFKTPEKVLIHASKLLAEFFPGDSFIPFVEQESQGVFKMIVNRDEKKLSFITSDSIQFVNEREAESFIRKKIGDNFFNKNLLTKTSLPNGFFLVISDDDKKHLKFSALDELIILINSAFENAFLYKKISQMAVRDGLTNLFNHQHFIDELDKEVQKAIRHKYPVSLLFLDIDYFKQINDLNGHQTGDIVLKKISKALTSSCRKSDIISIRQKTSNDYIDKEEDEVFISRYGGEEFTVILPITNIKGAHLLAERLREKVEKLDFDFDIKFPNGVLTISVGVAEVTNQIDTSTKLIKCADYALYEAKDSGRNKVILANEKTIEQVCNE